MLGEEFHALAQARDWDELRSVFVRFAHSLGFDYVGGMAVIDRVGEPSEFIGTNNGPVAFRGINDPVRGKRCPVMQHCKQSSVPLVWDQSTYVADGSGDLWEHQAAFGYRSGAITALHLPRGRHYAFGVDRPQPLPRSAKQLTKLLADVQLFTVYAGEAMAKLVAGMGASHTPALARRELECLRWTMEGKTAWEVGQIVGIAELTVVSYMRSAAQKLGCTSKHQAVARAMRLGLIW